MKEFIDVLRTCPLFHSMEDEEILSILSCLSISVKSYPADSYLFFLHDTVDSIGIVLEGTVEILKETVAGNRHIISQLMPGNLFGEGIVCTAKRSSPVTVHSKTAVKVLFIPYLRIIKNCSSACSFHTTLIRNLCMILGEKNYFLNQKIDLLMLKGMRQKLAQYLLNLSEQTQSSQFNLPYNRNELAEFLNVARTSMCRELGRMKEEGLIDFHKNRIHILDMEGIVEVLNDI